MAQFSSTGLPDAPGLVGLACRGHSTFVREAEEPIMQFLTFPVCHLELRYRTLDMIHRGFRGVPITLAAEQVVEGKR